MGCGFEAQQKQIKFLDKNIDCSDKRLRVVFAEILANMLSVEHYLGVSDMQPNGMFCSKLCQDHCQIRVMVTVCHGFSPVRLRLSSYL